MKMKMKMKIKNVQHLIKHNNIDKEKWEKHIMIFEQ